MIRSSARRMVLQGGIARKFVPRPSTHYFGSISSSLSSPSSSNCNDDDRKMNTTRINIQSWNGLISNHFSRKNMNNNATRSGVRNFSTSPVGRTTSCDAEAAGGDNMSSASSLYDSGSADASISNLVPSTAVDTTSIIPAAEQVLFSPTWYNPVDHAVTLLNYIDSLHDNPYAYTIVGSTLLIRTFLVPIFVKAQQNNSRMAHMNPELNALKERMDKMKANGQDDQQNQLKNQQQMQALFKKYECNPLKGLIAPLVQMPLFMSMFFALRKMPDYFSTELSTGGMLWFPDLTAADPYMVLPVVSSLTFIATIEISRATMAATGTASQTSMMVNVFRGMGVIMIPLTMYFPSAVLTYWVTNNSFTLGQTYALQHPAVKQKLGIWEAPVAVRGAKAAKGFPDMIKDLVQKLSGGKVDNPEEDGPEAVKRHNREVENKKLEWSNTRGGSNKRGGRGAKRKRRR